MSQLILTFWSKCRRPCFTPRNLPWCTLWSRPKHTFPKNVAVPRWRFWKNPKILFWSLPFRSGFFFGHSKKTQGEKNSKLKENTKTQAQNSNFRHFLKKIISLKTFFIHFKLMFWLLMDIHNTSQEYLDQLYSSSLVSSCICGSNLKLHGKPLKTQGKNLKTQGKT